MNPKIDLFECFLYQLVEWFCDYYKTDKTNFNNNPHNNLSKIKAFKLHFFACSTIPEKSLNIFDTFKALPYGHVEIEVDQYLHQLKYFNIGNEKLEIINFDFSAEKVNREEIKIIKEMTEKLRSENEQLISWGPFKLVELSHKWFSWRYNYKKARQNDKYTEDISNEIIKQETKIYNLS